MRYQSLIASIAFFVAVSPAAAQQPNTPPPQIGQSTDISTAPTTGQFDFGFRGTIYADNSDEARYQRYRDLRNGPFIENFRFGQNTQQTFFDVRATHVGYRDQQYVVNYNRFGNLRATFEFNEIPLFFSQDTETPYQQLSPGDFSLNGLPLLVQAGVATTAIYAAQASPFDLRLKRSITDFRLTYSATQMLDLSVAVKNTQKNGQQPWAGTFGFGNAVELPAPVDTGTTDVGAAAQWAGARAQLRIGYDGSFFRNRVSTLIWDNPLRAVDAPSPLGPSQGRMSLWPNSNVNSGSVSGLVKLPANSQATAYVSLGNWSQNDVLIPFTINTALQQPTLDRQTADAKARVTSTNFVYNARPVEKLWLSARFRSYDFDNRTPVFNVPTTVSYDTNVVPFAEGGTSPYSFTRKAFDAEGSWTPLAFAAFRLAYTRDVVDQTFRTFDTTTDNVLRASADLTSMRWLTVRAVYEHAKRVGSGLDEQSLDDIGEQVSLRQFDISDRNLDRFSGIVIVTASPSLSFNGTVFVGREDRPGAGFGLRSNDNDGESIGFDYVPTNALSVGASYEYERYSALQASRQANPGPQFNDPTRDWTTDSADRAHTVTASADLLKVWRRLDLRFSYDYSRAQSTYVYGLAPNTTLPPVSQLPPVLNSRNRFTADGQYPLNRHLAAGLVYWYEKYTVDDFAFNPSTLSTIAQPAFLMIGYLYRPYTANTIWARLTYFW
jgi:MtrB/PioB family decaheme-associated outer membrane protein